MLQALAWVQFGKAGKISEVLASSLSRVPHRNKIKGPLEVFAYEVLERGYGCWGIHFEKGVDFLRECIN